MTTITLPISPLSSSNSFLQLMGDVNLIKTLAADARYYVANSTFQNLVNNVDGAFVLNSGSVMKGPLALDFNGAVKLRLESNTAIESSILLNLEGSGNPDFKLMNDDNFKILKGNDGNTFDSNYLTILGTNGNIGIGTASPAVELQVETNGDTNIAIVSGTSGISSIDFGDSDDRNAGLIQYLNTDNAMTFRTSGSGEDMRIDSSGHVLIGTTSSTTDLAYDRKLKISGSGPALILEETDTSQMYTISALGGSLTIRDATNTVQRMTIDSSGNVGIGTNNPQNTLHISSTSPRIRLTDTDTGVDHLINADSSAGSLIFNVDLHSEASGPGTLFYIQGSEKVRIDSAGNVGIGVTSPVEKLDVNGNLRLSGASTAGRTIEVGAGRTDSGYAFIDLIGDTTYTDYGVRFIRWNNGANADSRIMHRGTGELSFLTQESAPITFRTNNTERVRINSAGRVGIGTSTPSYELDVVGTIHSSTGFVGDLKSSNGTKVIDNGTDGTDAKYEGLFWSYGGNKYNTETGTTYTLIRDDAGITKRINNGSGTTITVPTNATVAFPIGTYINFVQEGAGQITFSAAGGVTLNHTDSHTKSKSRYAIVTLYKLDTNVWILGGSTAA